MRVTLPPLVDPVAALSDDERRRTARHTSLVALGDVGQRRLRAAHVAVVGAGGLGSPVLLALAAAGVGTLTVIDDDVVEVSNLQRQVMHRHRDAGAAKVASAQRVAADLSPETTVVARTERLTAATADAALAGADLVIDGSDTFETRRVVAAATEARGIPLVWGTVQEFDGQVTVFWSRPPHGAPAVVLDDLYPAGSTGEVPTCAQVGVLGALCLQVGSLMATEAVKLIAGIGEPLLGRVLVIDGLRARQREVPLRGRGVDARLRDRASEPRPARTEKAARTLDPAPHVAPRDLAAHLEHTSSALLDVREPAEVAGQPFPHARTVPLAEVLRAPADVEGPVVVICQVGMRAQRAADALRGAGIDATVLHGGVDAWLAAGSPESYPQPHPQSPRVPA